MFLFTTARASIGRADTIIAEPFAPGERDCQPNVWFQAINSGVTAPTGHAWRMPIASGGFGRVPLLGSSWVTITPQRAFLTLVGGTVTTYDINDRAGAPITDVRGSMMLSASFDLDVDTLTGDLIGVLLQGGFLLWTPTHVDLVRIGGTVAAYDVTASGVRLAGIRGIVRRAADVQDTDPS